MKVDALFASRVAEMAAQMISDGWPYGTFDKPDWNLPVGAHVEVALMRAAEEVWGGPGWWRGNMDVASECLRSIRWAACDDPTSFTHFENESQSKARWSGLDVDDTVLMLLFVARWLRT